LGASESDGETAQLLADPCLQLPEYVIVYTEGRQWQFTDWI